MLILIFDPAAWLNRYNLISEILGTILFVDVPIGMCIWHWFKPEHFREWRWMIPFGLMTLVCWAVIAVGMWIDCRIGHGPENGFSIFCAYAFGWAYIWLTMIPIGAVYVVFRAILKLIPICREWKMSDPVRKTIRNILLALIPCGILLCVGILSAFKLNTCARIVFSVFYPPAGIVLLVLFTRKYIFSKPWRKLKKVFAFLLAVLLWYLYMILPPAVFVLGSMERGDIFFIEKSPDPKIEAAYFNDGEFRNNCYAVHIRSFNRNVSGSPMFHTKASVFQKVKVRWDGSRHFIFESSDVGVIHFRYRDGKWTATPENLLYREKPDRTDRSNSVRRVPALENRIRTQLQNDNPKWKCTVEKISLFVAHLDGGLHIMITGPGIGNLSALADHDFDTVILIDTEIANTDFLKNSHSLRVLAINNEKNNVREIDFSGLKNKDLKSLFLCNVRAADFAPIKDLKLSILSLRNVKGVDCAGFTSLQDLKSFTAVNMEIRDIKFLCHSPKLRYLHLSPEKSVDLSILPESVREKIRKKEFRILR